MIPQVAQELDNLHLLNETELAQLTRQRTGFIVARGVNRGRLIEIFQGATPDPASELSGTNESRKRLQLYIEKNWNGIQSQLPCKGENRGRCTIYPCSEGRHVDCLIAAGPHLKMHGI